MLAKYVEGIDIMIGGHRHSQVTPPTLHTESSPGEAYDQEEGVCQVERQVVDVAVETH